ncbi:MAG: PIG-L family deacetylase [Acidobacteria bacterium]|nr:MAG: PIG-L family deacetylase [Acidobacteriota bacterium]
MKFTKPSADVYIPDGTDEGTALSRTTHLCVVAHQDDTEIMAYHGIAECFGQPDKWFSNVTVTNGAGSPRSGIYGHYTDEEMQSVRRVEQRKAAVIGGYSVQIQLDYSSSAVKDPKQTGVCEDLLAVLRSTRPRVVYLHNLADKHDTHIAVALRALSALRSLEPELRPARVYGCEVCRYLDWPVASEKQVLPVSAYPNLAAALVGIFDSQVGGGKRYDLAIAGRRLAAATFLESHETDKETAVTIAMDLTPLVSDPSLDVAAYVTGFVDRLKKNVEDRLRKFS